MRVPIRPASGFTLIEMVLALSIFSLILLMAYQAIVSSAEAQQRVSQSVDQQNELRSAYRTLSNAFDSQAQFFGDKHSIEFDLSSADSEWLEGVDWLRLVISNDQRLSAYIDSEAQASRLLSLVDQAEFSYIDGDLKHLRWDKIQRPNAVELSWREQGELHRWRFDVK
ncbi:MAG: prepilin-type N-terminal cleavage/methylation domain-containing protein [Arenicella sp.]|jgi:prepilin-type N-terminal cleavage/methylation domain-containing protein